MLGLVLAVGLLALVVSTFRARPDRLPNLTNLLAGQPECTIALLDKTTATLSPDQAAALTTAAVTGAAADPGWPVDPQQIAIREPQAVSCRIPQSTNLGIEQPNELGLTPRAAAVHAQVREAIGRVPYGGFAPLGVTNGHGARSAHYEGRAVDYFFRPLGDAQQQALGWATANWLVANAARLEVAVVIFDDRIWSARRSAQGWRPYTNPEGLTDPISRHLDHVHMDVARGR